MELSTDDCFPTKKNIKFRQFPLCRINPQFTLIEKPQWETIKFKIEKQGNLYNFAKISHQTKVKSVTF